MNRVLAFDQAVHISGWALGVDQTIERYGLLKRTAKTTLSPADRALPSEVWMRYQIVQLVREHRPDVVAFEGVHLGENVETLIALSMFLGGCVANIHDLGVRFMILPSYELNSYLHLRIGTGREVKKSRSQFIATADVFGTVVASDGHQALLDDNISDAVNLLRIAEGKLTEQSWVALADAEDAHRSPFKSARAKRRVRA